MADETGYNGWANYETWAVALWINNDQGWQESVFEQLRGLVSDNPDPDDPNTGVTAYEAGQAIKANIDEHIAYTLTGDPDGDFPASLATDLLLSAVGEVDWSELGASFLRDLAEQEA